MLTDISCQAANLPVPDDKLTANSKPEQPRSQASYAIRDWSQVPIQVLNRRLSLRQEGARALRAIREAQCRTIADVLARTDVQWLNCPGFGQGSLEVLHEELKALTAMFVVSHERSSEHFEDTAKLPLDDPSWRPKVWSEFTGMLDAIGPHQLGSITANDLIARLNSTPRGTAIAEALLAQPVTTMADLLEVTQNIGVMNSSLKKLNGLQLNLLMDVATDYLRSELGKPSSNADSLWNQIQDQVHQPSADGLKLFTFSEIAKLIQNVRVRNALLRHLPRSYTLYDVVMTSEQDLLQTPNFGPKSLDELKLELIGLLDRLPVRNVAQNHDEQDRPLSDLKGDTENSSESDSGSTAHLVVVDVITHDWDAIKQLTLTSLPARQLEIVRAYYGSSGTRGTLSSIGHQQGFTRERVRQLKSKASRKFSSIVLCEEAARAFRDYATSKLQSSGVRITPYILLNATNDPRVVSDDERWLLAWFEEEVYGRDWYRQWITDAEPNGGIDSQVVAGANLTLGLAQFLQNYCYRPFTLDEMLVIAQFYKPSISAYDLRTELEEHPEVRLYIHGDLQIGHASWSWFDPQRARESKRAEWALRLIHKPASPDEIAQVIRERLGVFDVSAFSVADACEGNPDTFFEQNGYYGIALWQHAASLRQPLMELLADGPALVTDMPDLWAKRFDDPFNPELVMAALHTIQDSFRVVKPLCWARSDYKEESGGRLTSFTFEDLMPTL